MTASIKPHRNLNRRRPVHFVLREEECPGLIDFLESLENRMAGKTLRAILFKWFKTAGETDAAALSAAAARAVAEHEIAILQDQIQQLTDGRHARSDERLKRTVPKEIKHVRADRSVEKFELASDVQPSLSSGASQDTPDDSIPMLSQEAPVSILESKAIQPPNPLSFREINTMFVIHD